MRERPDAVRAFVSHASFDDIGTPRDYFETSFAVGARENSNEIQRGARTLIGRSATVSRSILWDEVVVDDGAVLTECIVTDGVRVPRDVQLVRSLVLPASAEMLGASGQRRDNLLIAPF